MANFKAMPSKKVRFHKETSKERVGDLFELHFDQEDAFIVDTAASDQLNLCTSNPRFFPTSPLHMHNWKRTSTDAHTGSDSVGLEIDELAYGTDATIILEVVRVHVRSPP